MKSSFVKRAGKAVVGKLNNNDIAYEKAYAALAWSLKKIPTVKAAKRSRQYEFKREVISRNRGESLYSDFLPDVKLMRFFPNALKSSGIKPSVEVAVSGIVIKITFPKSFDAESVMFCSGGLKLREVAIKEGEKKKTCKYTIRRETLCELGEIAPVSINLNKRHVDDQCEFPIFVIMNPEGRKGEGDLKIRGCDKKGFPVYTINENKEVQKEQLELYARVRKVFKDKLGRELFALYGTLLGCVRDNALIEHDDDFDVGYLSKGEKPRDVKKDTLNIIKLLLDSGFYISINNRGRAFCVWDEYSSHKTRLDVRPVWFEKGKMWAHLQACLELSKSDFVPFDNIKIDKIDVCIPCNATAFLEKNYGAGWRVPDPSYTNSSVKIPSGVHEHLAKTCFSVAEMKKLKKGLAKDQQRKFLIKPLMNISELAGLAQGRL